MRILFIYLVSIFLFNGLTPGFSGTQQYSFFSQAARQKDKTALSTCNNLVDLPELSLLNDDDDELSPEKKKKGGSRAASGCCNTIFIPRYNDPLKHFFPSASNFCYLYPDRYIFQRVIRI